MAKIRAVTDIQTPAITNSITVPLPEHETNDLLLVFVTKDTSTGGAHSTPSGWTKGGENTFPASVQTTGATTHRAAWYYRVAASSAETDPTITSAWTNTWTAVAISIRGVDTSNPIDASNTNGVIDNVGAPLTASSINTATNNALVFYTCATSQASGSPSAYPGVNYLIAVDSESEGVGVGYTVQRTAGATGPHDFYTLTTTNPGGILFTVAVRDGSSGTLIPGYVSRTGVSLIHPVRGNSATITGDAWVTNLTNYPRIGRRNWYYVVQEDLDVGFTNLTSAANSATTADFAPFPATEAVGDYCAFGYYKPFQNMVFDYASGTAGAGGVVVWEYWSGSNWQQLTTAAPFYLTDGTTSFTAAAANGLQVRWAMPANWKTRSINGSAQLYFVRARITTVYTTNPVLDRSSVSHAQLIFATGASTADIGVNPFENAFTPSQITSSATTISTVYYGRQLTLGSSVNLSGTIIVGTMHFTTPRDYIDLDRVREGGGEAIILADSSHNHKSWMIAAYQDKDTEPDERALFSIQWNQTRDTTLGRTLTDPSNTLANVVFAVKGSRGTVAGAWNRLNAVTTYRINGGSSANPIDLDEFRLLGNANYVPVFREGEIIVPVTIGGGDPVHLSLNLFNFTFPPLTTHPNFFTATPYTKIHCDPNTLGFILDARSGDTLKLTNGSISSTHPWQFTIPSTASSAATWDFSGLVLTQATVTANPAIPLSDITFTNCGFINPAGCAFSGNTIASSRDSYALVVTSTAHMALVTNCEFKDNTNAIRITTTGTFTFSGLTFSDNTYDVENFNNARNMDSYNESNLSSSQALGNGTISGVGQSFTGDGTYLASAQFYLKKIGTPSGNAIARVYAHSGTFGTSSVPTGSALASSSTYDVSQLSDFEYRLVTFNFTGANEILLTNGTRYVVSLEYTGSYGEGSFEHYVQVGIDNTSPTHSGNFSTYNGSTWTAVSGSDACFYIGADADAYTENNQDATQALGNGTIIGIGQSFVGNGQTLANIQLYLSRTGSPTGNAIARIYAHSGTFGSSSVPTGSPLASSEPINVANLNTSLTLTNLFFIGEGRTTGDNNITLTNATNYVLTLEYSGGNATNYVNVGIDSSSPTHGGNFSTLTGTTWTAVSGTDAIFRLRTGGIVVINSTNGSNPSQSKVNNSGNPPGSTTINATVNLTVNGLTQGVRVSIIANTTTSAHTNGDIIASGEANSSGIFTTSYSYSVDQGVNVICRLVGFLPFETSGTITSTGLTVTAVWQIDPISDRMGT